MSRGQFSLVLHAHLPFVRHPELEAALEERWLFEALTECYVPLLLMLRSVQRNGWPARITLSISPPLAAMLQDTLLTQRYRHHLALLAELAEKELRRNANDRIHFSLAGMYLSRLREAEKVLDDYHGDLLTGFLKLQEAGVIELMTSSATHGYLPLLQQQGQAVDTQLQLGQNYFTYWSGAPSQGVWLPECGYLPGLEREVAAQGFRWFVLETHGLEHAQPQPLHGTFAPVQCPNGVLAFGRDPEIAEIVWSSQHGYPGDPWYRDFYRDIGYDLDPDYIGTAFAQSHTGFKYHRITGCDDKAPYLPRRAQERCRVHAADLAKRIANRLQNAPHAQGMPPILVAPFDAELFGHWWFEGPEFIGALLGELARHYPDIRVDSPTAYAETWGEHAPVVQPAASSWGFKGYNECWLSRCNEWVWPLLHYAATRLQHQATRHIDTPTGSQAERALNQALRCLLLAQASDWTFIIHARTSVNYAEQRIKHALARFDRLLDMVECGMIDRCVLAGLEELDRFLPCVDFRSFSPTAIDRPFVSVLPE